MRGETRRPVNGVIERLRACLQLSSPPGLAGPAAHETFATLRPRRRHRGRYPFNRCWFYVGWQQRGSAGGRSRRVPVLTI